MARWTPALLRLILLPVVIAGVLAMHALAGGGHMTHPTSGSSTAVMNTAAHPGSLPTGHLATMTPAATTLSSMSLFPIGDGPDVATLTVCLAILLGAAVSVAACRRATILPAGPRLRALPWTSTARPSRAPPRDLLAQLCVLRT